MIPPRRQPSTQRPKPTPATAMPRYSHCGEADPCPRRACACGAEVAAEVEAAGGEVRR